MILCQLLSKRISYSLYIGTVLGPVYAEYLYGSYKARLNAEIGQNSRYIRIGEHNLRIS